MILNCAANEGSEISPRFRQSIETRIERLERDADADEIYALRLFDVEHIRRQLRLVAAQRAEAVRMRLFLARTRTRLPHPMIEL
jgi:ribosome-associated translation inhibitor RaiA